MWRRHERPLLRTIPRGFDDADPLVRGGIPGKTGVRSDAEDLAPGDTG
jgi:hypothetical protein